MICIYKIFHECLINPYVNIMFPNNIIFFICVLCSTYTQAFAWNYLRVLRHPTAKLLTILLKAYLQAPSNDQIFHFSQLFMLLDLTVMKIWSLEEWKLCGFWYWGWKKFTFSVDSFTEKLNLVVEKIESVIKEIRCVKETRTDS